MKSKEWLLVFFYCSQYDLFSLEIIVIKGMAEAIIPPEATYLPFHLILE